MPIDYFDKVDTSYLDKKSFDIVENLPAPHFDAKVIVTIPAHNESTVILDCLQALVNQVNPVNLNATLDQFEVILLCHNCTDDTFSKSLKFKTLNPSLNLVVVKVNDELVNNVGAVRRLLMNIAYSRLETKSYYIATTDADTLVDPFWIAQLSNYLMSDYDLICGKINVSTVGLSSIAVKTIHYKTQYFELKTLVENSIYDDVGDFDNNHFDNSGPNLAVRGHVYHSVDGIKPIGFCEDVEFYDSVIYHGFKTHHCNDCIVVTSGRTDTKAPWGFGAEVSTWENSEVVTLKVQGLEEIIRLATIKKLIHSYFLEPSNSLYLSLKKLCTLGDTFDIIFKTYSQESIIQHKIKKALELDKNWQDSFPKEDIASACSDLEQQVRRSN